MQLTSSSKKIKLLVAVPSLECGGLERNVSNLCNNIDNGKFETTLVVVNNESPFYKINNPAVTVIDLKKKKVSQSVFAFKKIISEKNPDIILSTANHLNLLLAIFKPLFSGNFKFVARESSIVSINTKRNKYPSLFDFLLKLFYRKYDIIICQSEYMCKDLVTHYHVPVEKTRVINNAVEIPENTVSIDFPKNETIQLITVGRLSQEKGFDRIIRSLHLIKKKFHYTIIGDGPERNNIMKLITQLNMEESVSLIGSTNKPYARVKNPDLFLMGSHYEGFPNVILEANSLGIPVIAFNAPGGIAETIKDFENGILVENGNEKAFAAAIEKSLDHDFNRKSIQTTTLQRYSVRQINQYWEDTLMSLFS